MTALELAGGEFGRELFDANVRLVGALEDIGLELITMFDATTGILTGTALATQQIVSEVEDAGETQERGIGNNLLENAIARARFNLTGATTEQEFETARQALIRAINEYYDAEETRINMLMLSEDELQDLREDNDLARDQALRRATNATNTFAEERIRTEQRTADERLREEERVQNEIEGLRQDALEAEARRLETIEDLHLDHNRRLVDLERDLNRDIEDLRRERLEDARGDFLDYDRRLEDLQNRIARRLFDDAVSFGGLTAEQQQQVLASTEFQRGRLDLGIDLQRDRQDRSREFGILRPGTGGYQFYRQQFESGQLTDERLIRELFGTQGLDDFIDNQRGQEDAETRLARGIIDATTTYETAIMGNTEAIQALTTALMETATPPPILTGGGGFNGTGTALGSGEVQVVVQVQPQDVMLDGEKVGQVVGNTIVRQGQNRRNILGQIVLGG